MRECYQCKQFKPDTLEFWYKDSWHICKKCRLSRQKEYYRRNAKKVYERTLKWVRKNRDRVNHCRNVRKQKNPSQFYWWGRLWKLKQYGISIDEYKKLLKIQNNKCAICGKKSKDKILGVDHCHTTKKVRGLLCDFCNRGLGSFNDDIQIIRKAVKYLEKH